MGKRTQTHFKIQVLLLVLSFKYLRQTPFFSYLTLSTSKRLGATEKVG